MEKPVLFKRSRTYWPFLVPKEIEINDHDDNWSSRCLHSCSVISVWLARNMSIVVAGQQTAFAVSNIIWVWQRRMIQELLCLTIGVISMRIHRKGIFQVVIRYRWFLWSGTQCCFLHIVIMRVTGNFMSTPSRFLQVWLTYVK